MKSVQYIREGKLLHSLNSEGKVVKTMVFPSVAQARRRVRVSGIGAVTRSKGQLEVLRHGSVEIVNSTEPRK